MKATKLYVLSHENGFCTKSFNEVANKKSLTKLKKVAPYCHPYFKTGNFKKNREDSNPLDLQEMLKHKQYQRQVIGNVLRLALLCRWSSYKGG